MPRTDEKCLTPGCERKPRKQNRGCCQTCYLKYRNAISKGQVEERDLVRGGLLLPAEKRGRKPQSPAAVAIAAVKSKSKSAK